MTLPKRPPFSLEGDMDFLKLKKEHQEFLLHVLGGETRVHSYQLVYPKASYQVAANKSTALCRKKEIKGIIDRDRLARGSMIEAQAQKTIENLQAIAFADVDDLFDEAGKVKEIKNLPKAIRQSITEIEINGDGTYKLKLNGKIEALKLLAKITRLTSEHSTNVQVQVIAEGDRDAKIKDILVKAMAREE